MSALLESQIKKQVAAAFKGKLVAGTIRRTAGATLDSLGNLAGGSVSTYAFEGIRESYSAIYRNQAGIPAEDVKFLVLLGSTTITPEQGDQIKLSNTGWHQIREIPEIDPAGATAACQCYAIPDPS